MKNAALIVIGLFLSFICQAQIVLPKFSEPAFISQQVANTHFTIEYERPKANNRKIYGGLVPYGKVWRTGAAECTKIRFDTDVYIDSVEISAGTYSLFTIPGPEAWTIIINSDTTLYGAYGYNDSLDLVRVNSKVKPCMPYQNAFSISIDVLHDTALLNIMWENTMVGLTIETRDYQELVDLAHSILSKETKVADQEDLVLAEYLIHNRDAFRESIIPLAEELAVFSSMNNGESSFYFSLRRRICRIERRKEDYVEFSKQHIKFLEENQPYEGYEKDIEIIKEDIVKF